MQVLSLKTRAEKCIFIAQKIVIQYCKKIEKKMQYCHGFNFWKKQQTNYENGKENM